jgi:BNR repeat-like domain
VLARHKTLRSSVAPALALLAVTSSGAMALRGSTSLRAFTRVGARVRVSSDRLLAGSDQQAEPFIALDPRNSSDLLGAAQEGRLASGAARADGFYSSRNGGRTWRRGLLPGVTRTSGGRFDRATDPVVAFGPDGTAFYASLALDFAGGKPTSGALLLSRSRDGGRTWGAPQTVAASTATTSLDEPWLAADAGTASSRRGALYIAWTRADSAVQPSTTRIEVSHSTDGGFTWSRGVTASGRDRYPSEAKLAVGPDGAVFLVYGQSAPRDVRERVRVVRSIDGGTSWSSPRTIATRSPPPLDGLRSGPGLATAVDASSARLHVVWVDAVHGRAVLLASRSSTGGRGWARPVRVDGGRLHGAEVTPAVAAVGGSVHVLFYTRDVPGRALYDVLYAQSLDGGTSFGRPLRVTSRPFDVRPSVRSNGLPFLGDYIGIVATRTFAQAIWVQPRAAAARRRAGNEVLSARIAPG